MIYNCIFIQYKSKVKRVINFLLPTPLRYHQTPPVTLLAGEAKPRPLVLPHHHTRQKIVDIYSQQRHDLFVML